MKKYLSNIFILVAVIIGVVSGYSGSNIVFITASSVSEIFISFLRLLSLPIIFLSITSTLSGMKSLEETKKLTGKVLKYTILTTIIAASTALVLFVIIDPVNTALVAGDAATEIPKQGSYLSYVLDIVPDNVVKAFSDNNVIGVAFMAAILGLAAVTLPEKNRKVLHSLFSSLFAALLKITSVVITVIPFGIWAFTTLFVKDMAKNTAFAHSILLYVICVVGANLIQGFIVLPLLLKYKGLHPGRIARAMSPALLIAFFTKSSNAALPTTMECAQENAGVSQKVASFSLPMCSVINMNGCAAFIITTVLFVSMSAGMAYSIPEMIAWIFIATLAAIGNAGVPMGCYFISSAFLIGMNAPLYIMGIILPIYTLIDMIETALNVWSDSCVTTIVDKELLSVTSDQ
ncbi:MAG: dicarboxylate/amino acid:cation symporter [Waddliaceae bacterium]|jgi:Na+/H+-dicarboxylate symporter|nr:dicarboxylate/amino acid:cation symporter [Waddliaceae bacterium]MBT3579558.1 dicarboxylate/amino acid:cation symporter [Waddliaceae bacterium]MBT4444601.1 dicarboxylate/amino acid:cation symporter [Waddliaceae bacterium]MBT6928759.1 dicarboxylate/amino acid:cation symporter [Waddliaceae bacterium]MBT7461843.1 dicarboxylate/amino acid:cation symporter [Waddliaceae bacterium]